jgi:hypothetical protein
MKITVRKKAETKKTPRHSCPWIVEDMLPTKRQ